MTRRDVAQAQSDPGLAPTVVEAVLVAARARPDATAIVAGDARLSYGELARRIRAAATDLGVDGVEPGDRCVLAATNTPAFVVTYFAIHLAGAVAVPVDAEAGEARFDYIRERVAAARVLGREQQQRRFHAAADRPGEGAPVGPDASALADIMFTSGTTGEPKGVMLSHGNLRRGATHVNAVVGTCAEDIEVIGLPFAHSFGLGSMRCVLAQGACAVLVPGFAFPGRIFAALEQHAATGLRCVPAGLATLFRLGGDKLGEFSDRLRYMELGSAPLPREHGERLMQLLPDTRLCMHYGLTEATRSVYTELHRDAALPGSIGTPAPGVDVRIVDETGEEAGPEQYGEIRIRGPHVMQGYWQDPERTQATLRDGWLHTGDSGYRDAAGNLYLSGRKGDMINVGGRKVSPIEVENALRTHAAVRDCACVGIPDPAGISGEVVAMLVVPASNEVPSEKQLRRHLRDVLEAYKLPVKWAFGDAVPATSNGKVRRQAVREQVLATQ